MFLLYVENDFYRARNEEGIEVVLASVREARDKGWAYIKKLLDALQGE